MINKEKKLIPLMLYNETRENVWKRKTQKGKMQHRIVIEGMAASAF